MNYMFNQFFLTILLFSLLSSGKILAMDPPLRVDHNLEAGETKVSDKFFDIIYYSSSTFHPTFKYNISGGQTTLVFFKDSSVGGTYKSTHSKKRSKIFIGNTTRVAPGTKFIGFDVYYFDEGLVKLKKNKDMSELMKKQIEDILLEKRQPCDK